MESSVKNITFIDPPGENMGDHLQVTSLLRADTMILTIDLICFNAKNLLNRQHYRLDRWEKLIGGGSEYSAVREYLRSLYFATRRDKSFISPKNIFKARSFILFINDFKDGERGYQSHELRTAIQQDKMGELVRELGSVFGVEGPKCQWFVGNAAQNNYRLVATAPEERLYNFEGDAEKNEVNDNHEEKNDV